MHSFRESGEGRASFLLWLVILIVGGLAAYEWVPARIKVAELQDYMVESAEMAHAANEKQIKKNILIRANELDIPLDDEHLTVEKVGGKIRMKADYVLPLELPLYTYEWKVDHDVERSIFLW